MATFTVTETSDRVDGSLRDAIARANTRPGPDVIVFDSSLSGQTINLTGPRLNITGDLTINGLDAGVLTIDGNGNDIFGIPAGVANIAVTLTGVTLTDADDAIQVNGGANAVTLTDSRVADARVNIDPATGEDATGDGLRVEGDRNRLTVQNSVFERNGDNIDVAGPTEANPNREPAENNILEITNSTIRFAREDGLAVSGNSNTVTVLNSTVNGNGRVSMEDPNDGIDINGDDNALNMQQVTISSNGEHGLDIEGDDNRVALQNSTLTNNVSDGVIIQDHDNKAATNSTVFVENSIIAGNMGERSSAPSVGGADIFDPFRSDNFISGGYNLIGNGTGSREFENSAERGPGDLVGIRGNPIDARLGPLEANGGPTATHALLSGSPAIDAGDPDFTPPPEFDQRGPGFPRVQNDRIDIGAVESALDGNMVDSIFVREAGEDGDDLNAEWRMFFRSQDSVVAFLREDNVHDGDRHAVEPGDFALARGDGNPLRFSAGGFENDIGGDRPTQNNDRLPGIEVEIQPFDVGGGFPTRGAEFGYTLTMGVSGRLNETGGAAATVNRSDFAYEVTWRVESGGSGEPVEATVERLHIVEAGPTERINEWNPTFVAGTVGSLGSFTPLQDAVRDGQDFDFGPDSPERTLGVDPAGNDVLILRAGGFEADNNLPDMLPIGEVVIRPADGGFGLAMAVDGGEFAYEVNWRINPVSGELLVEEELDSFPVVAGQGENLGLLAQDEIISIESTRPSEPAPPSEPEPFAIPLLGVASDADVFV